jgi:hypothetical protein
VKELWAFTFITLSYAWHHDRYEHISKAVSDKYRINWKNTPNLFICLGEHGILAADRQVTYRRGVGLSSETKSAALPFYSGLMLFH